VDRGTSKGTSQRDSYGHGFDPSCISTVAVTKPIVRAMSGVSRASGVIKTSQSSRTPRTTTPRSETETSGDDARVNPGEVSSVGFFAVGLSSCQSVVLLCRM
jgi:hypothetical protein